jgi:hypothetical protein
MQKIVVRILAGAVSLTLLVLLAWIVVATHAAWPPEWAAWNANDWAAFGGIGTLLIALVTGPLILRQVIHAREGVDEARRTREQQAEQAREQSREQAEREQRLREEEARPLVVVDFEPSPVWGNIINLVVENVGKTLAKNVRFTFDPPLVSSGAGNDGYNFQESNLLKHGIPAMPPGKRFEALFDMSHEHITAGLPMAYSARVDLQDSHGRQQESLEYVLDLNFRYGVRRVESKGIHDVAKSLKEIERRVDQWTQHHNGLNVWIRDEDARIFEENWQEEHGGHYPTMGDPLPAGRPAPSRFSQLREPLTRRLYWTARNNLVERPRKRWRLRGAMKARPDLARLRQPEYDSLQPWWSRAWESFARKGSKG